MEGEWKCGEVFSTNPQEFQEISKDYYYYGLFQEKFGEILFLQAPRFFKMKGNGIDYHNYLLMMF